MMSKGLIPSFTTGSYTVTRQTEGEFIKGRYEPGPQETLIVRGSLQPADGRSVKMLEEGERVRDVYTFFSDAPLTIIQPETLGYSDRVTINGERYRVISVKQWQNQFGFNGIDLSHYETTLVREPQQ